jgi:large subunit ribosomal protein L35
MGRDRGIRRTDEGGDSMPKQKTHKGTKKRFRLTAGGKAKHRGAGTSHLASRKSKKRRRNLRRTRVLKDTMLHQITRALAGHSS